MEWGAAIASVLGIILLVLKQWQAGKPKRSQEQRDEATQNGRDDIGNNDAVAIDDRIDRLLIATGNPAGQPGGEVTAERIRAVAGLADTRRSPGPDTGTGRGMSETKRAVERDES
jgi:hypothetical protein